MLNLAIDAGMRRRRTRSLDPGIMVAELEGQIERTPEEESHPGAGEIREGRDARGRPGETGERRVDVNPFWSQRAVDEAYLQAMRPEDLPKVPGSDNLKMVEVARDENNGEGALLREIFLGMVGRLHPEAAR